MKKYISLIIIALSVIFTACEKDGEMLKLADNVVPPDFLTVPSLSLERSHGNDSLMFTCSPVNAGFQVSANYFIEVCATGDNFENKQTIFSGSKIDTVKIAVKDLNQILLKIIPENTTASVDIRIRADLVVDAGTGAPGTGDSLFEYISKVQSVDAKAFGLPRLNLVNSGRNQNIKSASSDGTYFNYVKLDSTHSFTLTDPETGTNYGGTGGTLSVNGSAISISDSGWYAFTVDLNNMTYTLNPYMIGITGSSTPDNWGQNGNDQKMDYDDATGTWYETLDLAQGEIKFRKNDSWSWNLGGTPDNLVMDGSNITISTAGNYTITLTITSDADITGTCTIVLNQ